MGECASGSSFMEDIDSVSGQLGRRSPLPTLTLTHSDGGGGVGA